MSRRSRQSPTLARSTIGRGRLLFRSITLPGVRDVLPVLTTTSLSRAKITPPGWIAPSRFSQNDWSRAATFAVTVLEGVQAPGTAS